MYLCVLCVCGRVGGCVGVVVRACVSLCLCLSLQSSCCCPWMVLLADVPVSYLSVCLSVSLHSLCLSVSLSLSIHSLAFLPLCCFCLSVCRSVSLSVSLSLI